MHELKLCPFCGSDYIKINKSRNGYLSVRCMDCGTETNRYFSTTEDAVDFWNARYNEKTERLDFDEGTWQKFGEFEICNCCGFTRKVPREDDDGNRVIKAEYKFCPWCGKKMKEEVRRCMN